jgi:endonuclease/exonuclease/phosphatase family metal-dependent hydrolase
MCLLAALIALAIAAPGVAQAFHNYKFFHFNMCGNVCHEPDDTEALADKVVASLNDGVDMASLNEVCYQQFTRIRDQLPSGWEGQFVVAKAPTDAAGDHLCEGTGGAEHDYGNAIFSRPGISNRVVRSLPHATSETRKLLCVTAALAMNTRLCTTHIAPCSTWGGTPCSSQAHENQKDQITEVRQVVNPWVNDGQPVILMGDFNAVPPSPKLDQIYSQSRFGSGAWGHFEEADQYYGSPDNACRCGEATHRDGKIDYIFASNFRWKVLSGNATSTSTESDHVPVRATLELANH